MRAQTRQAGRHTGLPLPGAPRGHGITAAAADVLRIGATDLGTARLNGQCGRICGSGMVVPGVSWPPPGEVFDPGLNGGGLNVPGLAGPGAAPGGKLTPDGKGAPRKRRGM